MPSKCSLNTLMPIRDNLIQIGGSVIVFTNISKMRRAHGDVFADVIGFSCESTMHVSSETVFLLAAKKVFATCLRHPKACALKKYICRSRISSCFAPIHKPVGPTPSDQTPPPWLHPETCGTNPKGPRVDFESLLARLGTSTKLQSCDLLTF